MSMSKQNGTTPNLKFSGLVKRITMELFQIEVVPDLKLGKESLIYAAGFQRISEKDQIFIDTSHLMCKAQNTNVNIKRSVQTQTFDSCDGQRYGNLRGNQTIFSKMYDQVKAIGFNQIKKTRMKSDSSKENLLKPTKEQSENEEVIRRTMILKVDVNNSWILLQRVLRHCLVREIPVIIVHNLNLAANGSADIEQFLRVRRFPYACHFANQDHKRSSNVLLFYMTQPYLNFHLARCNRYHPRMNEQNNLVMADIIYNQSRFQLIALFGTQMSEENEQRLYLRMNRIISNTPTILIVQSPNGRFHNTCADGDLVLRLADQNLMNQLEDTDDTLVYISRDFPQEISDIRVFTGKMKYNRNKRGPMNLEACIVATAMPLNQ